MFRILALAAALFAASPALADVSGRYRGPDGAVMLVEATDDGNGRMGPDGGNSYGLFTAEGAFVVWEEGGVVRVARYADLKAAMDAQLAEMLGEEAVAALAPQPPEAGPPLLEAAGEAIVGGRTGAAWREAGAEAASLVLSRDPALRPLGAVLARAVIETPTFETMLLGRPSRLAAELAALLESGAPLRFADAELTAVAHDAIPAARFALPAAPLSVKEIQAAFAERDDSGDE